MADEQTQDKTYVATARTALAGPEDGIMKKLPRQYAGCTVGEVLGYLTDKKQLTDAELTTARSIEQEMKKDYTVSVNGRPAKVEDKVTGLFQAKKHRDVEYESLEIEVSSVQEGGLELYLLG